MWPNWEPADQLGEWIKLLKMMSLTSSYSLQGQIQVLQEDSVPDLLHLKMVDSASKSALHSPNISWWNSGCSGTSAGKWQQHHGIYDGSVTSECTALLGWKSGVRGVSDRGFSSCAVPTYYCGSKYFYSQCPQFWNLIGTEFSLNRCECRIKNKAS